MPPTQETQLRHDKSFSIDAKGGRGVGGGWNACKPELNKHICLIVHGLDNGEGHGDGREGRKWKWRWMWRDR